MKHPNLPLSTIEDLMSHPRSYSRDPYLLLTSFILYCIKEMLDEDEELWGKKFNTSAFDTYIDSCYQEFFDAAFNGNTIRINNEGFTIRKLKGLNINEARKIFQFPVKGDESIVCPEGVFDIRKNINDTYKDQQNSFNESRFYFWKVMQLATQTKEGWDKLTDMEVAIYCWAAWIKKTPFSSVINDDYIQNWWDRESEYFGVPLSEVKECFKDELVINNKLNTYFAFDCNKVHQWNELHKQHSYAEEIPNMETHTYWTDKLGAKFIRK